MSRGGRHEVYRVWGNSWLRSVPSHWKTGSLRHFCSFTTGFTPPTADDSGYDGEALWANISDLKSPEIFTTGKTISPVAAEGAAQASPGDLLFGFKLSVGAVSKVRAPMYTNEAIATFSASSVLDMDYAFYAFPVFVPRNANTNIYGAPLLNSALIRSAPFAAPDVVEQRAIADYLDRETAQIDALIGKQERLIATLRERRIALIERVVFGGLDPDASTSHNGVEWLPSRSPSHWRMTQLGFFTRTLAGNAFASDSFSGDAKLTRLLRGVNIKPGRLDWSETVYWDEETEPVSVAFQLEEGDLVLGMDRPFVSGGVRVAAVNASDLPALLLQRVMRLRAGGDADQRYLARLLSTRAFLTYLEPLFTGVSVPHMSEWQVRKFRLSLPPVEEQRGIAAYLDEQTTKINVLIAKAERFIELSKERRAALITAAVTGQIDVREAV